VIYWKNILVFLFSLFLFLSLSMFSFAMSDAEATEMTEAITTHMKRSHGLSQDQRLIRYLEGITSRLQKHSGIDGKIKVVLVESDMVNAFVSAGNTVFISPDSVPSC